MAISFIFIIKFNETAFLNKISPNNVILFNVALRHKLLNIPFASCYVINIDFLQLYIIVLPLLVFETLGFILSVFFLHFKQLDDIVL